MLWKKIGVDFVLNILANLIAIASTQLIVYPVIADSCDAVEYGFFLTILGVLNILGGTFGNSLNNVRLITNAEYHKMAISGDYSILLLVALIVDALCVIIGFLFWGEICLLQTMMILVLSIFSIVRNYVSVEFRLKIDYKKVLLMNIFISVGYFIGIICYKKIVFSFNYWVIIFLTSEILCFLFLYKETILLKEPLIRTKLFFSTFRKYGNLVYSSLISSVLLYFDRNILLPLMGGAAVSTYFAATVIGKGVGMFASPISSVLLSYLGQVDFHMSRRLFWQINGIISLVALLCYGITLLLVDLVVQFLYPSLYSAASPFFGIANLVPIFTVVGDLARPTVLRYIALDKLSIFNTGFLILTCVISYYSIVNYGLLGFCYGAAGLALFRVLAMWGLGDYAVRQFEI